jgi:hypothetical protein
MDVTEEEYLNAVVIHVAEDNSLGRPVTRIELLSPTNKPPGEGYRQYREKRNATLRSGVSLIEIDYLHQTQSPIWSLPSYPDREAGAQPYNITVNDPRPSLDKGLSKTYAFGVDDPIPIIEIPLAGNDHLVFDLMVVYNETFERTRFYQAVVDYEQPPLALDTYSPVDQERIEARMRMIQEATRQGIDLEQGPFPPKGQ